MTVEPASPVPVLSAQPRSLTLRLSIMMFLQWGMFGLWAPLAGMFILARVKDGGLGFSQYQLGWLLGISGSIGALAAPFIAGQIADRYFSTQRLMTVILVIGGVLWWIMSEQRVFGAWLALSIAGSLALAPTMALSNSLAFAHMSNPTKQFPVVRVWGTIGWIVAMWVFAWVWLRQTFILSSDFPFILLHESVELTWKPMFLMGRERADVVARTVQALKAGAVVAFVYAAYCLTLPNTPPKRDAAEKLAFWKAFWVIVLSLGFHGICFACYYAAAFIYVERLADEDIRHTAQTLFGILIAAGPVIGGVLNGFLAGKFTPAGGKLNYTGYWYTVAIIGLLATLVLALFFRDEAKKDQPAEAPAPPAEPRVD